jgi:hypothetical protein
MVKLPAALIVLQFVPAGNVRVMTWPALIWVPDAFRSLKPML